MRFDEKERIFAIHPSHLDEIASNAVAEFGEIISDDKQTIRTIAAHWDEFTKTRIRAASIQSGTICGTLLSDGRIAFMCLWQVDLIAAFEANKFPEVEELNMEQFLELKINTD